MSSTKQNDLVAGAQGRRGIYGDASEFRPRLRRLRSALFAALYPDEAARWLDKDEQEAGLGMPDLPSAFQINGRRQRTPQEKAQEIVMRKFSVTIEQVQPFAGFECPMDMRINGTWSENEPDHWRITSVDVSGRYDGGLMLNKTPLDGWRDLPDRHPLRRGAYTMDGLQRIIDSQETADLIETAIREAIRDDGPDPDVMRERAYDRKFQQAAE